MSISKVVSNGRNTAWIVVVLLLIHAALLAYSATRHSPTFDEPGHLVAGLSHWDFGRFELYRVNPPLVRMVAALPVIAAGYEEDWSGYHERPGARPVFGMGADFIKANGKRSLWLLTIARWSCIPFSLIGGLFCFCWSRELWGHNLAGLISLSAWCFEPNILAHGELITPDCAATSFGLGACYFFWRWLKQPSWSRAGIAGLLFGVAQLSKMTWIILFGLWPLLWLIWFCFCNSMSQDGQVSRGSVKTQLLQLASILLFGLYLLNLGYGFDGTFTPLKDYTFVSSALTGLEESGEEGNRFQGTVLESVPIPLPKQYLLGFDVQKHDFEDYRQLSYLRGEWKDGGWWYYYLYAFAVKTPHGFQLLLVLSGVLLWYARDDMNWLSLLALLVPGLVVFVLVSAQLEFNHHFRYVLPSFGFLFVFAGVNRFWWGSTGSLHTEQEADQIHEAGTAINPGRTVVIRLSKLSVVLAVLATVASTLRVFPHQLSYFNEVAGGPASGHNHLLESNVDWGQDLLFVEEWMDENQVDPREVQIVTYGYIGRHVPYLLDGDWADSENDACWRIYSWQVLQHDENRERLIRNGVPVAYTHWAVRDPECHAPGAKADEP
ncbi:MAG: glycosyltransferase family 39 protein [Planctomycetaceae bacterium]|nr:glycosyltransferase family 39 protein [Planctomycetaceae bacterium]MCB9954110.1 glycosyltransferase family 39 protein [Planctomycetaceae bacterium]